MFEQVFDNLQKATESSVKMQQEMFQKWVEAFPSATSTLPTPAVALADFRKEMGGRLRRNSEAAKGVGGPKL